MGTPLVSIVVQSYNMERFLAECVASVCDQRGDIDLEIIVVDDASTDGTVELLRSFRDPRIRCIRHSENRGAIATANEGFAQARGQYIARIDGDDRYRPGFLARTAAVLESSPEIGLVYGDIAMIDTTGRLLSSGSNVRRRGRPLRGNELMPLLQENFVPAPTTIARREAWRDVLPIPADLSFCDWYLTLGIAERWDFCYVNEVLADYRIHSTNMHRTMILDLSGEATAFRILDLAFRRPTRADDKRRFRNRIYSTQYLVHGDKYFGCGMNEHARRCYLRALRHRPQYLLHGDVMRRLVGTYMDRSRYERLKRVIGRYAAGRG